MMKCPVNQIGGFMASNWKPLQRSLAFWLGSALPVALFLTAWIIEQALPQSLGEAWSNIPWGWLTICGLCVWVGYLLYDATSQRSVIREFYKRRFGPCEFRKVREYTGGDELFRLYYVVRFKNVCRNVDVYFQQSKLGPNLDTSAGWHNIGAIKLIDQRDYSDGEEEEIEVVRREKGNLEIIKTACGDDIMYNYQGTYRFIITVVVGRKMQEEAIILEFPGSEMPRPVEIHPDSLSYVKEGS